MSVTEGAITKTHCENLVLPFLKYTLNFEGAILSFIWIRGTNNLEDSLFLDYYQLGMNINVRGI